MRLVSPIEGGGTASKVRDSTAIERLYPATPAGGVAGRTLRYWRRDPRYLAGIAGFLIGPIVLIITQVINPQSSAAARRICAEPAWGCWWDSALLRTSRTTEPRSGCIFPPGFVVLRIAPGG